RLSQLRCSLASARGTFRATERGHVDRGGMLLKNPHLRRFWFQTEHRAIGFGVTAFSVEDAWKLLYEHIPRHRLLEIRSVVEDVDVESLDEKHVRVNMGPPNFRGIWFPFQTLGDEP